MCRLPPLVLLAVVLSAVRAIGEHRDPTAVIASVLLEFVHTCTSPQRATLRAIADDQNATTAERRLAAILVRVDHRPNYGDRAQLRPLTQDASQPRSVRTLARVLENLIHTPTRADQAELAELLARAERKSPE